MSRSALLKTALMLAVVSGVVLTAHWWWTHDRLLDAGGVVVVIEGREIGGSSWAGVGGGGTLALVGERCVGFEGVGDGEGTVIVWPSDTEVRGEGEAIVITTGGTTLRLGDEVEGGIKTQQPNYRGLADRLPAECADAGVMPFDPNG